MARLSVIVPICILAVSGCAVFDSSEMSQEPQAVSVAPLMELAEAPPEPDPAQIESAPASPPPPSRRISTEDVGRLQRHLRDVGFDPGPIDGIAGPKTRVAFDKLAEGCAQVEKLPQALQPASVVARSPSGEEVIRIQTSLRDAGFHPGPIDGIYGARTRKLVTQIPVACVVAREYPGSLDGFPVSATTRTAASSALDTGAAPAQPAAKRAEEASCNATVTHDNEAREEVRILQLRLRDAGFDPGPFDGIMGAKTRAALAQYEASQRNTKVKTSLSTSRISGQY